MSIYLKGCFCSFYRRLFIKLHFIILPSQIASLGLSKSAREKLESQERLNDLLSSM